MHRKKRKKNDKLFVHQCIFFRAAFNGWPLAKILPGIAIIYYILADKTSLRIFFF